MPVKMPSFSQAGFSYRRRLTPSLQFAAAKRGEAREGPVAPSVGAGQRPAPEEAVTLERTIGPSIWRWLSSSACGPLLSAP